jgi:uncharacterized protein YqeY
MSLLAKIDEDLVKALKAGEKVKATVLRGLKSDFKYKKIDLGRELTDEDCIGVLSTVAKKIKDSIEQFEKGGREDLVEKEENELEIVQAYLPQQLGEEELRKIIEETIKETGATSPQQMGLVMKAVMPKTKGRADGKLVSKLTTELLAK